MPFLKPLVMLGTGLASAALLISAGTGTFSVFTASVQDGGRSSTFGTLVMEVATETSKCVSTADGPQNAARCDDLEEFGARTDLMPGDVVDSKVRISNTGTLDAGSLTLTAGRCDASSATPLRDAADKVRELLCNGTRILLRSSDERVFEGTPAKLADAGVVTLPGLKAGESTTVVFETRMPDIDDNIVQGTGFTLPLTWTFTGREG